MKKMILICIGILSMGMTTLMAVPKGEYGKQDGFYMGVRVGANGFHTDGKSTNDLLIGGGVMLGLGYHVADGIRLEGDIVYRNVVDHNKPAGAASGIDKSRFAHLVAGEMNLYFDLKGDDADSWIYPYIGVGAGVGHVFIDNGLDLGRFDLNKDKTVGYAQAMLGLGMDFDTTSASFEYRNTMLYGHMLSVGYNFDL